MEKKIAIGLIKLDVLNNIDAQDSEALQYLKRNEDDFPWKELGDYQNLVALLALTSKIEEPDPKLKNIILQRLYSFKKANSPDEVFETIEENILDSNIYAEETTQKFTIETNGEKAILNEGPVVEVEEFEIGATAKSENGNENIPNENDLNQENILEVKNVVNKPVQEQIYEIEEYDLEMAHEDIINEVAETTVAVQPEIQEPEQVQTSVYEIEEYDYEVAADNTVETNLIAIVDVQNITPESVSNESELIPQIIEEELVPVDEISIDAAEESNELEIETIQIASDQPNEVEDTQIQKDDDVIIYDENESVDQIASKILDDIIESPQEIISESKPTEIAAVNEPEIQKINVEKDSTSKSETNGDSISFREPNLSQLHILFKDSKELMAKEKEIRQEFRAKLNNENNEKIEKTEKAVLTDENKIKTEHAVSESKPADEIKNPEPEIVTQNVITDENEIVIKESSEERVKSPVKLKKESGSKSTKKVIFMAAAIVIICASVLFFMQSSDEVKGEQIKIAKTEQNPETYENVVEEKKPEGLIIVEDIQPVKQKNTVTLETENKLPAPPQKPKMIEPEIINEIKNSPLEKIETNETVKKEIIQTPPKEEKKGEDETVYFVAVEEMPSPIGGLAGIQSKVYYPNIAKLAGVEGKVLVLAYVDESGNVAKVELVKGIGAGCDEVALDAVRQTKFKPGVQRGKPVKVRITIPIVFKKS